MGFKEEREAEAWEWSISLESGTWRGTGGASERVVAESLGKWATMRGGLIFVAGIEEIAIESGLSEGATRRALRRLEERGWIKRLEQGGGRLAPVWRLLRNGEALDGGFGGGDQDWTRWGAIGKSGFLTWRCAIGGAGVKEIAEGRKTSVKHTRKMLRRLQRLGVVSYDEQHQKWWALDPDGLDQTYKTRGAKRRDIERLEKKREERSGSFLRTKPSLVTKEPAAPHK